jgi:hypothetical protein
MSPSVMEGQHMLSLEIAIVTLHRAGHTLHKLLQCAQKWALEYLARGYMPMLLGERDMMCEGLLRV